MGCGGEERRDESRRGSHERPRHIVYIRLRGMLSDCQLSD